MERRNWSAWLRFVAGVGIVLMAVGLGAFVLSANRFGFFFSLGSSYQFLFLAIGAGLILSSIGLIGHAAFLDRKGRTSLGGKTLLGAITSLLVGLLFSGTNVHGSFYLVFFAMIPVVAVGLVILLMAVFARHVA